MGVEGGGVRGEVEWGIGVGVEGGEGKVLYVWLDGGMGYMCNRKEVLGD